MRASPVQGNELEEWRERYAGPGYEVQKRLITTIDRLAARVAELEAALVKMADAADQVGPSNMYVGEFSRLRWAVSDIRALLATPAAAPTTSPDAGPER